jgi:hypothetical protein
MPFVRGEEGVLSRLRRETFAKVVFAIPAERVVT